MNDYAFPTGNFGVFIYGSLFHKPSLNQLFEGIDRRVYRATLDDYQRVFDLVADRRDIVADRKAVLNLHAAEEEWCNGLLVTDVGPREYGIYARRETEYRHRLVDHDKLAFYQDRPEELPTEVIVACDAPSTPEIKPIPGYLKKCLKGAREWGPNFYNDFVHTTTLASGETLATYLSPTSMNNHANESATHR